MGGHIVKKDIIFRSKDPRPLSRILDAFSSSCLELWKVNVSNEYAVIMIMVYPYTKKDILHSKYGMACRAYRGKVGGGGGGEIRGGMSNMQKSSLKKPLLPPPHIAYGR